MEKPPVCGIAASNGRSDTGFTIGGLEHELAIHHIEPAAELEADFLEIGNPLKAKAFLQGKAGSLIGGCTANESVMPG